MEKTPPPYSLQFPTIQTSLSDPIRFSILFEGLYHQIDKQLLKTFYFAYSDIEGSFEEKLFEKKTYPGYKIYSIKRKTNIGEIILDFYHLSFARIESLKIDKKIKINHVNELISILNFGNQKILNELNRQQNQHRVGQMGPVRVNHPTPSQPVVSQTDQLKERERLRINNEMLKSQSDIEKLSQKEIQKLLDQNDAFTSEQSQLVFYHQGDLQLNFDFDVQINRQNYFLTTISPSSKSSEAFYLSILRDLTKNNFLSFGDDDPEEIEILRRAQEILKKKNFSSYQ